jgi:hypothetical protein
MGRIHHSQQCYHSLKMTAARAVINPIGSPTAERLRRRSQLRCFRTSTDSINALKFNMRLLSAEQLWAQIGFFYYGQKGQVKF